MFRIVHLATGKILNDQCHTEKEARTVATSDKRRRLEDSKLGRRSLMWLANKLPWTLVEKDYSITEMIGVWIDSDEGRLMPDCTTEENDIVFVDKKGVRHIGLFDAEEGLYLSDCGTTYTPEKVVEFMVLPESAHEPS